MSIKCFKETLGDYLVQERIHLLDSQTDTHDYLKNLSWVINRRERVLLNGSALLGYIDFLINFFQKVETDKSLDSIPNYTPDDLDRFKEIRDKALRFFAVHIVFREIVDRYPTFEDWREQGVAIGGGLGEEVIKSANELYQASALLSVREKICSVDFLLLEPHDDLFLRHYNLTS
ncbi:MAG: hypothetical protein AABX29_02670 [Nanoarchaeota archaeon]|mgnify:CR=1 FL=1